MVTYTNPAHMGTISITPVPRKGQTVSGYGGAIPTRYMVEYLGHKRRVRMMQYGNSGSAYVMVKGDPVFLDIETEYRIEEMARYI